jgi:hypothetical protein
LAISNGLNFKKETLIMPQQMIWFFVSIALSLIAWGIVTARYIWPELRHRESAEALRPLLILHSFRFMGLAMLVPGVVSPDLPLAFAHPAALGDIIAAILAVAFAVIAAQCGGRCRRMALQRLGFGRSPQRFLPGQSRRAVGWGVGSRILPSDFDSAAAPHYARTRFSYSAATST